jgi:hypothetical protein
LHLGYQLILQEFSLSAPVKPGDPLHIHCAFLNSGAASANRPGRELDKDVPCSYKIQLELKNADGKVKALLRHTPPSPTCNWLGLKPISWDADLKAPALPPGKYDVSLALIDEQSNRRLNFLGGIPGRKQEISDNLPVGSIEISPAR